MNEINIAMGKANNGETSQCTDYKCYAQNKT